MEPPSRLHHRQSDLDFAIDHPNRIGWDVDHGREGERLPGLQIEVRSMPGTLNFHPYDFTFSHRPVVVRAHVGDGEVAAGDVEDGDNLAIDVEQLPLAVAQFVDPG